MCNTDPPDAASIVTVPDEVRWNRFVAEAEEATEEENDLEDTSSLNGAVPCAAGFCSDGTWLYPRN